jgi:hypothetical protein
LEWSRLKKDKEPLSTASIVFLGSQLIVARKRVQLQMLLRLVRFKVQNKLKAASKAWRIITLKKFTFSLPKISWNYSFRYYKWNDIKRENIKPGMKLK